MQKLIRGLETFQQQFFEPRRELFERLAEGQAPEVLFITCSDSRINPNLITQSEPGELFIIRNAGNVVPPHSHDPGGEAATIEYAVGALGVTDIIICGHSGCGAMAAVLEPEKVQGMPLVAAWLHNAETTRRIVRASYGHLTGDELLTVAVEENVLVQIEHLRTQPAVATALSQGRVRLHAWVYEIETGEVFSYDPAQGQYAKIEGKSVPVVESTRRPRAPWA